MVSPSRLTALQLALVEEFFRLSEGFFLTGGAALAGFHLGHRQTHDLDFFTTAGDLDSGVRALRSAAARLGAQGRRVDASAARLGSIKPGAP